ncbi:hypothetical protein BZG36_03795 [Bifiguratus adelaidae]|uniref:Uncharacterized protein n=1 Tax=Bifiguratus adelaidae TaxID=1938954 RepID=A0A261XX05_9FUNG|nr:hypothetical protein BZG36_03795 [Bifiguratus adelaidae]
MPRPERPLERLRRLLLDAALEPDPPPPSRITPQVYLSSASTAASLPLLAPYSFTHILNLCGSSNNVETREAIAQENQRRVERGLEAVDWTPPVYCRVDVPDAPDTPIHDVFMQCIAFMERAERVLVHCFAGQSRAPTIVMAYLIARGALYEEAMAKVKKAHPSTNPNSGFERQLKEYAAGCRGD